LKKRSNVLFFFLVFLIVIVILIQIILVVRILVLIFVVIVIRNGIDLDGMNLHDFHFGFALSTGQDFAFLDFVFININFGTALRTTDHGTNLLGEFGRTFY